MIITTSLRWRRQSISFPVLGSGFTFSDYITFVMQRVFKFCLPKKRRKEKKLLYVLHRSQWTIIYRNRGHKSQIDVRKMNNKFTNTNENKSRRLFISFLFMIYFDCLLNDVLTPYCGDNTMQTIQNELKRKCSFSFNKNRVESHEISS